MTMEGQASNIGATAFAVSNIETQKQMVGEYLAVIWMLNFYGWFLVQRIEGCENAVSQRL